MFYTRNEWSTLHAHRVKESAVLAMYVLHSRSHALLCFPCARIHSLPLLYG